VPIPIDSKKKWGLFQLINKAEKKNRSKKRKRVGGRICIVEKCGKSGLAQGTDVGQQVHKVHKKKRTGLPVPTPKEHT